MCTNRTMMKKSCAIKPFVIPIETFHTGVYNAHVCIIENYKTPILLLSMEYSTLT